MEWLRQDGTEIGNNTILDASVIILSPSNVMLLFSPLRTSHKGIYWCRATAADPDGNSCVMNNSTITIVVKSKFSMAFLCHILIFCKRILYSAKVAYLKKFILYSLEEIGKKLLILC